MSSGADATDGVRGDLAGKRITVFYYSHLDWAWCFSRRWHEARYVRIFDEVLACAEADPQFCFFADSIAESLEPYFRIRPDTLPRWQRLVEEGRFVLVGGHYANLRPATAPEESYIRNIEVGQALARTWFPDIEPTGFANLDTGIGHSQLPQVLSLAGVEYCLAGRPELGLELDGTPKMFRWVGPEGSELVTCVQHYGILCHALMRMADPDVETARAGREDLLGLLAAHARLPVRNLYAFFAMDDVRPFRHAATDERYDLARAIRRWNAEETTTMIVGTPDDFCYGLRAERERLVRVEGAVDQADVGYNGPFPQTGLRALRDRAAARLVEAEALHVLAGLRTRQGAPCDLDTAWKLALRAQSHAAQFLFEEDLEALRLDLRKAVRAAEDVRDAALAELAAPALPQDARSIRLVCAHPRRREQTVAIPILRTDFEVRGYEVRDASGTPLPQQPVECCNPGRAGEWTILVRTETPACGVRSLQVVPADAAALPAVQPLPLDGETQAGPVTFTWRAGQLAAIERDGICLEATDDAGLLEPVSYGVELKGWMTTALVGPPHRMRVEALRQTECGPLRWCFERWGAIGANQVTQRVYAHDDGRVECETRLNHGAEAACFGLALPCEGPAALRASIPFGVEARDLRTVTYRPGETSARMIERLIPGMFYARDWVSAAGSEPARALVVLDGDRYWYRPPGKEALVHLLLRSMPPVREGWERYAAMDRAGFMSFRHVLCVGEEACDAAALSRIADEVRFPVRAEYAADAPALEPWDGITVAPDHVRWLACRALDSEIEIRLVEAAGRPADITLRMDAAVGAARLTDFRGKPLPDPVQVNGQQIRFAAAPWQIRTLRVSLSRRLGAHMQL